MKPPRGRRGRARGWKARVVRQYDYRAGKTWWEGEISKPFEGVKLCGHKHRLEEVALRCAQDEAERRGRS